MPAPISGSQPAALRPLIPAGIQRQVAREPGRKGRLVSGIRVALDTAHPRRVGRGGRRFMRVGL